MNGTHLRFINALILIVFCVLGLTGLYGLYWSFPPTLYEIHRLAAWGLIVLIPGKTLIAWRSLRRGWNHPANKNAWIVLSLLLAAATLLVIILAVRWNWQIGSYYVWLGPFSYSAIGWHWGIALGLTPLFVLHVWRRWPRPKQQDFLSRRQALKLMGLGAATVASWAAAETLANALESTRVERRFTGSREDGSFRGLDFPITNGADQGKIRLDPNSWNLSVRGLVRNPLTLNYGELMALSTSEVTATIDCTGGWYSTQVWRGVHLSDLLLQASTRDQTFHLILRDISGYTSHFLWTEISGILLATQVGTQTLDHWHGYPLRAVVPARRGGHWVKWLTEIEIAKF